MNRCESVPLGRILKHLPEKGTWFAPAYQGPAGLFAIRVRDNDGVPLFQVSQLERRESQGFRKSTDISAPWLTIEGAERFAQRLAGGGDPEVRMT